MPNTAPPAPPQVRRGRDATGPSDPRQPAPALPPAWAGVAGLLAGHADRSPAEALTLSAAAAGSGPARPAAATLAGIWAAPPGPAAARSTLLVRALDGKGRLSLPLTLPAAAQLPAERDGAVLTVFLPQSQDVPRRDRGTRTLPISATGRLTLPAALRRDVGIPDLADVLVSLDPERHTLTMVAASRLETAVSAAVDSLRRPEPLPALPGSVNSAAVQTGAESGPACAGAGRLPGAGDSARPEAARTSGQPLRLVR